MTPADVVSDYPKQLNGAIMAKKQTEFRVTPEQVAAAIKGKPTFTVLPSGKKVVCELTLQNGFTVIGVSSVVDPRNFVLKTGKDVALENAKNEVWQYLGYETQTRLMVSNSLKAKPVAKTAAVKRVTRTLRTKSPVEAAAAKALAPKRRVTRTPRTVKPAPTTTPADETL